MKDFYAAVLKSGQFVKLSSIDEFNSIIPQTVECFLFARHYYTYSNKADWYWFSIIDKDGQPCSYKVGYYEVTFIGEDKGYTNFYGREITVHNCLTDSYYKYNSMCWYNRFILDEVKPLLEKLNQCKNEEEVRTTLMSHIPYDRLEYDFNLLKDKYESLKKESDIMEAEIEKLTSVISEIRNTLNMVDSDTKPA